jgi:hypothetical protein
MSQTATVSESLLINAPVEVVWDFTQDYSKRPSWDQGVISAEVVDGTQPRRVRVQLRGGIACEFQYKLEDRPNRTTLAMQDVRSRILAAGGGSWSYEARDQATLWTQTNSLTFRSRLGYLCLGHLTAWQLRRVTRKAMLAAKRFLETNA